MKKLTYEEADKLLEREDVGVITEEGCVGADSPLIVYYPEHGSHLYPGPYLITPEELDVSADGIFVRLKHPENVTPLPNFEDVFEARQP